MMHNTSALLAYAAPRAEGTSLSLENAGTYLKELRRAQKLSQSDLAEVVAVGRGTIERLEHGDDRVRVGTVFQVLRFLGASPWHYYDLAIHPQRTIKEIHCERAVVHGIETYVRVLAERRHIPSTVLSEVIHASSSVPGGRRDEAESPPSELALLRALIYLDAPLADLIAIVQATSGHEAIGRQHAEERDMVVARVQETGQQELLEFRPVPSLDVVVSRLHAIVRHRPELPPILKHELSRLVAEIERYRVYVIDAVGSLLVEP
jgi:transcriptional regulator with XRE-family HTH domain